MLLIPINALVAVIVSVVPFSKDKIEAQLSDLSEN